MSSEFEVAVVVVCRLKASGPEQAAVTAGSVIEAYTEELSVPDEAGGVFVSRVTPFSVAGVSDGVVEEHGSWDA